MAMIHMRVDLCITSDAHAIASPPLTSAQAVPERKLPS